ncbi:iron transporter [Sphingomonas sp. PB2P19]|uniref:iron transporter n=1 Tax=Sphingomonas rhamnosi TaxID=3096156 RepID=UPI002FCC2340
MAIIMGARITTALVGGYAAAAALATLAARLLPIDRAEATSWAMILSFPVYAGLALWAFHERRLARVALLVWGSALVAGSVAYMLGVRP